MIAVYGMQTPPMQQRAIFDDGLFTATTTENGMVVVGGFDEADFIFKVKILRHKGLKMIHDS